MISKPLCGSLRRYRRCGWIARIPASNRLSRTDRSIRSLTRGFALSAGLLLPAFDKFAAFDYYIGMFEGLDSLQGVGGRGDQVGEVAGGE